MAMAYTYKEHPGTNRINPTSCPILVAWIHFPRSDLLAALEEQHVHLRLRILSAASMFKMRLRRERQVQSAARCTKE